MTEEEWDNCTEPGLMLGYLRQRWTDRKLRLGVCAWARMDWHLLTDERSRSAIAIAERFIDEHANEVELLRAFDAAQAACDGIPVEWAGKYSHRLKSPKGSPAAKGAAELASKAAAPELTALALGAAFYRFNGARLVSLASVLRDLFGNPFRPVPALAPCLNWSAGTVPKLAEVIYRERAFDQLPVLGDALEEAGCTDETVVAHCRGPNEHVLGCWVLDLVLGLA